MPTPVEAERALWRYNAIRFVVLAVVLSGITVLLVYVSVARPMARMAEWTKSLKTGRPGPAPEGADAGLFGPLADEVSGLARRLYRAQQAAEQEAALRLRGESVWTEERLKQFVNLQVGGPIFVVSNREPVSHVLKDGKVVTQTPASGLVTAMEPVLRACGGVWVRTAAERRPRDVRRARPPRCARRRPAPPCAGYGSPKRRSTATTSFSNEGSGRGATSSTPGPSSGRRTGAVRR
jgi:trehalose 6-phosphate synthase